MRRLKVFYGKSKDVADGIAIVFENKVGAAGRRLVRTVMGQVLYWREQTEEEEEQASDSKATCYTATFTPAGFLLSGGAEGNDVRRNNLISELIQ